MNCIFICVFNNETYIKLLYLLLESIYIYGNLTKDIDILIYTSTSFMNIIKKSHLCIENIKFEINDNYNNIDTACKARLDLFNFPVITNYSKILYLDTDVLITGDIKPIFDLVDEDKLYVLEEGSENGYNLLTDSDDYWGGKTLFSQEERDNLDTKFGFTSGMMAFNNCEIIKGLFDQVKEDIIARPHHFSCYDQPYIVYNAFKLQLINKKLTNYAANNDTNVHSNKIIHHFPGRAGIAENKIDKMKEYLNNMKDLAINLNINKAKEFINEHLLPIIIASGEKLEGNIFMLHHTTDYTNVYENKAKNISNLVLNKHIKNVMEIGFNAGFSALLMLLTNPYLKLTCFDLGEHKYARPCFEKIQETFGAERINITFGDSTKTLIDVHETYDLIHIDGGHEVAVASSDIENAYRLAKEKTILIMDDYNFWWLGPVWNKYIIQYGLCPLHINLYNTNQHDVKYVPCL
jgi:predicted O-methyltransferase YrrM